MSNLRQFELLESLRPFGSAKAALLMWNGEKYVPTDEVVEIFEFVGTRGDRRSRGFARHSEESNLWEVVSGLQEPVAAWMPH